MLANLARELLPGTRVRHIASSETLQDLARGAVDHYDPQQEVLWVRPNGVGPKPKALIAWAPHDIVVAEALGIGAPLTAVEIQAMPYGTRLYYRGNDLSNWSNGEYCQLVMIEAATDDDITWDLDEDEAAMDQFKVWLYFGPREEMPESVADPEDAYNVAWCLPQYLQRVDAPRASTTLLDDLLPTFA